jgi:UDP-N-acetylglucosamine 2-epimerase (non-hydrolysing)
MKVVNVVGARPNFMKIAPLVAEMQKFPDIHASLVHTGQHYDFEMSQVFFQDLDIPKPDIYLAVGSASHAVQTANVMTAFDKVLEHEKPDLVVVVGDVNSTLACALVAAKRCIPVAHVEAGLRSFDRTMPEEVNRLLTDQVSDLLFVTSADAIDNLLKEGIARPKIHFVGNVMIDSLCRSREKALKSDARARLGLNGQPFALVTLHRPSNVDDPVRLRKILEAIREVSRHLKIAFPVHPRTAERIRSLGGANSAGELDGIILTPPLGRVDFLSLLMNAAFVMTDSGGLQEETTYLRIPCLTLRENTERPVTVTLGTNTIIGNDPAQIVGSAMKILAGERRQTEIPELWDGHASERIVEVLRREFR